MQFTSVLFKGQLCILFTLKQIISALNMLFSLEDCVISIHGAVLFDSCVTLNFMTISEFIQLVSY